MEKSQSWSTTYEELSHFATEFCAGLWGVREPPQMMVDELLRGGLLVEMGGGHFGFAHLAVAEVLAAKEASRLRSGQSSVRC
jgi:hypothetical protein